MCVWGMGCAYSWLSCVVWQAALIAGTSKGHEIKGGSKSAKSHDGS